MWSCGPTAIHNASCSLGLKPNLDRLIENSLCTARSGTGVAGMKRAIEMSGLRSTEFESDDEDAAWHWLCGNLSMGRPVILCIDEWEHYITVTGLLGELVIVIDPANEYDNLVRNGISHLTRTQLFSRWPAEDPGEERRIWGLAVY